MAANNKKSLLRKMDARAANFSSAQEISPVQDFAREADLTIADAEAVVRDPEGAHGVNADKAAALLEAIREEEGSVYGFQCMHGYVSFD